MTGQGIYRNAPDRLESKTEMMIRRLLGRAATEEIEVHEAARRQAAGALIVDVRELSEWADGHVPGATHIPLEELLANLPDLPRGRELLFICRSGNRSEFAADAARRAGISQARNIRGGMIAWMRAGLPVQG